MWCQTVSSYCSHSKGPPILPPSLCKSIALQCLLSAPCNQWHSATGVAIETYKVACMDLPHNMCHEQVQRGESKILSRLLLPPTSKLPKGAELPMLEAWNPYRTESTIQWPCKNLRASDLKTARGRLSCLRVQGCKDFFAVPRPAAARYRSRSDCSFILHLAADPPRAPQPGNFGMHCQSEGP